MTTLDTSVKEMQPQSAKTTLWAELATWGSGKGWTQREERSKGEEEEENIRLLVEITTKGNKISSPFRIVAYDLSVWLAAGPCEVKPTFMT